MTRLRLYLTPAILTAVRKVKVSPLPYLFVCAFIANAASFVLPISNPVNFVVFQAEMPPLGQWLATFGIPSLLSILATFLVMRILFREELSKKIEHEVEDAELSGNGKLVLCGLALTIAVLLTASAMKKDLGLPTCLATLVITATVPMKAKSNPLKLAREISWATLLLVAGLFIMVDALESQGALNLTHSGLPGIEPWPAHRRNRGRLRCLHREQRREQPTFRADRGRHAPCGPYEGSNRKRGSR